jgi:hypothetical protein
MRINNATKYFQIYKNYSYLYLQLKVGFVYGIMKISVTIYWGEI